MFVFAVLCAAVIYFWTICVYLIIVLTDGMYYSSNEENVKALLGFGSSTPY